MLVFRPRTRSALQLPLLRFAQRRPTHFTRPTRRPSPASSNLVLPLISKAISTLGSTLLSTPAPEVAANVVNVAPEAAAPELAAETGALWAAAPIAAAAIIAMGDNNPLNQIFGLSGGDTPLPPDAPRAGRIDLNLIRAAGAGNPRYYWGY
ncbi:MAG TPA: hypothetical protein VF916_16210 [Ktedonobacterales bacterium]